MPIAIPLAIAGATVATSAISANAQKKAAQGATNAQVAASQNDIAEKQRQFEEIKNLMSPFIQSATGAPDTTGGGSLGQQQDLLGLNGPDKQAAAIAAIEGGPQFGSMVRQGENAILQNASATGGLRGGNTQAALAQFRPDMLAALINEQYAKLGGMTSLGQNAAAFQGNAGMQTGAGIGQAYQQIGAAQAGGALARGQATSGFANNVAGATGMFTGMGGFGSGAQKGYLNMIGAF